MPSTLGLFAHIETLHGDRTWGSVLDAGTGVNSADWTLSLPTKTWTGITAAPGHAVQVKDAVGERLRRDDRLLIGNWMDPELLKGETFDVVLADYLLGAVEGFGPYFQNSLFKRLRPMVGGVLYVTGLDPYIVGDAPTPAARLVREIGRMRDVCLLLADETPYREYPAEWVRDRLEEAGFHITSARRFANRYKPRWIDNQLNMGLRRLSKVADRSLAAALAGRIEALRTEAHAVSLAQNGLAHGHDYIISAEPVAIP